MPVAALGGLDGAQMEDLAGEVPVVEGLAGVDALVALQSDQVEVEGFGERLGEGRLAGARLALEQQGTMHREGEVADGGQTVVGEVAGPAEPFSQVGGGCRHARGRRLHDSSIAHQVLNSNRLSSTMPT